MSERVRKIEVTLRQTLAAHALDDRTKNELQGYSFQKLVAAYIQWTDKFVRPAPRSIVTLDGFDYSHLTSQEMSDFFELVKKIERGDDLINHLSHRAMSSLGTSNPKSKGIRWSDSGGTYDMFLNAYGVHHLHLIAANQNKKRKGNSDTLLFVGFFREQAVLIMLGNHSSFHDGSLQNAAADFQGASGFALQGIIAPSVDYSEKDQRRLLRNGVNTGKQTKYGYVPSSIASAGNSNLQTMHADRILDVIEEFDELLNTKVGRQKLQSEQGWKIADNAWLEYVFDYCHFALFDTKNNKQIFCIPWRR